jgi:hypothetical protein
LVIPLNFHDEMVAILVRTVYIQPDVLPQPYRIDMLLRPEMKVSDYSLGDHLLKQQLHQPSASCPSEGPFEPSVNQYVGVLPY